MKIIISDTALVTWSDPPSKGDTGASAPVVPGKPLVVAASELAARPASTITSPGAAVKLVSIVSSV